MGLTGACLRADRSRRTRARPATHQGSPCTDPQARAFPTHHCHLRRCRVCQRHFPVPLLGVSAAGRRGWGVLPERAPPEDQDGMHHRPHLLRPGGVFPPRRLRHECRAPQHVPRRPRLPPGLLGEVWEGKADPPMHASGARPPCPRSRSPLAHCSKSSIWCGSTTRWAGATWPSCWTPRGPRCAPATSPSPWSCGLGRRSPSPSSPAQTAPTIASEVWVGLNGEEEGSGGAPMGGHPPSSPGRHPPLPAQGP